MFHGTTILCVRRDGRVVIGGDGQVTLDKTVMKAGARKVRRLGDGRVLAGFAGSTADAFTLFERFESKLQEYKHNLARACVELGKDWRTDRFLRRLEALLIVADAERTFTRAYELDAANPVTGYNLADLLFKRGDYERAQFYIRRLNNTTFANAQTLWLGIKVERQMQNREAMLQLADQLRRRFGQSKEMAAYERGAFNE